MLTLKERFIEISATTPRPQSLSLRRLSAPTKIVMEPSVRTPSMLEELRLVDAAGYEYSNANSYCAAIDAYLRGEIGYENITERARVVCARRKFSPPTR